MSASEREERWLRSPGRKAFMVKLDELNRVYADAVRELEAILRKDGRCYPSDQWFRCMSCGKAGGGNCELCSMCNDGEQAPVGVSADAWAKVDRWAPSGCWLWLGPRKQSGYSSIGGKAGHRVIYKAITRQDIAGLVLHHTCGIKHCVNPSHLQPMTRSGHGSLHGSPNCQQCGVKK